MVGIIVLLHRFLSNAVASQKVYSVIFQLFQDYFVVGNIAGISMIAQTREA